LETAIDANNASLRSVALARNSVIFTETGQPDKALIMVGMAQEAGKTGQSATIKSWLRPVEAEAHANLHHGQACERLLANSAEVVALGILDDDTYWTGFNVSRMAGYKGACLVRLGKSTEALKTLTEALNLFGDSSPRRRPRIMVDMAHAYVQDQETEQACKLATQA
jgi:hypothetical protein